MQAAQLGQPHAVAERPAGAGRGFDGQPGLADPPRPGERDQPGGTQCLTDQGKLGPPPDELRQLAAQPGDRPHIIQTFPCCHAKSGQDRPQLNRYWLAGGADGKDSCSISNHF
jgi:hypothetical protein